MTEVSCLYQHLCSPRERHLNNVYKNFRYLQENLSNNAGRIVFESACVHTYQKVFQGSTWKLQDWKDFYPYAAEAHSRKKLEPLGEPVTVPVYVDANHAGEFSNSSSHLEILIHVNNELIIFYSEIHNTFESSSFGLEFVELIIATEMVESLQYKFRKFSVNLEVPAEV